MSVQEAEKALEKPLAGRTIADEAREPSIDIVLTPGTNWLGHTLRMDERRTEREVLLQCVKSTAESLFW